MNHLHHTMEAASKRFNAMPEYLKRDSARPQSASIYRTVQPENDTSRGVTDADDLRKGAIPAFDPHAPGEGCVNCCHDGGAFAAPDPKNGGCQNPLCSCHDEDEDTDATTNKLQRTMDAAAEAFNAMPEYLKRDSARPQSASIYRTVQPEGATDARCESADEEAWEQSVAERLASDFDPDAPRISLKELMAKIATPATCSDSCPVCHSTSCRHWIAFTHGHLPTDAQTKRQIPPAVAARALQLVLEQVDLFRKPKWAHNGHGIGLEVVETGNTVLRLTCYDCDVMETVHVVAVGKPRARSATDTTEKTEE